MCAAAASAVPAKGKVPPLRTTQNTSQERLQADSRGGSRPGRLTGTAPSEASLNVFQRQRIEEFLAGATATMDTLRLIALQVQFADSVMGGQPGSERDAVRDFAWFANELEHLDQYYRGASRQRTEVVWTLVDSLYTLPEGMGYYGNDRYEDTRVVELAQTLIDSADADVDFSRYHNVFIIHAGAGQETDVAGDSPEQIWSSFYDLGDIQAAADSTVPGLETGDSLGGEPFYVNNFSVVPESGSQDFQTIGTLGIWAFETGSRLGLLPMFDSTPSGFTDSQGVGNFCVMAYGLWIGPTGLDGYVPSFPCAFNRLIAGWIDPPTIDAKAQTQPMRVADINSGTDPDTLCVKIPITENEYYLVVNRVHDTNFDSLFTFGDVDSNFVPENGDSFEGAEFDYYLNHLTNPTIFRYDDRYGFYLELQYTGSGIYVWHIDENVIRQTISAGNLPNDFVERKGVDLEEADGVQDLDGEGFSGFIFGSHFDSFRAGDGNATSFGPSTKPNTNSNLGIASGVLIENVSVIGSDMTFELSRSIGYEETRTRWTAQGAAQPPSVADLDDDGVLEIVILADTGLVYIFNADGTEYNDADADSATIDPTIEIPGAFWAGPPALGNRDADPEAEIVASAADGRLFAWSVGPGPGGQVTGGLVYTGRPMAAPPLLLDFDKDGEYDIAIVESESDSLHVAFVAPDGSKFWPADTDQTFGPLWPLSVQGQLAAPLALARTDIDESNGQTGVVLAWVDTLSMTANNSFTPVMWSGQPPPGTQPAAQGWTASWSLRSGASPVSQIPSPPAAGDIDADKQDEVVVTTPDGRVLIFDDGTGVNSPFATVLRSPNPSGPALGDVDLDGTLEIAVWDDEYMYLLKSNGSVVTNWPRRIVPLSFDDLPPNRVERALESPVIGDFVGDDAIEAIFPLQDGSVYGFTWNAAPASGFPRVGPSGSKATATVAAFKGSPGSMDLVIVGFDEAIRFYDTVVDTTFATPSLTMSIQSLPGSDADNRTFWPAYQAGTLRQGDVTESVPLGTSSTDVLTGTFMVYPNPVPGGELHARITLNTSAEVVVEIYNLEGERAFKQEYAANASNLIDTPFDEAIDVSRLKSGVYFLRMQITSSGGTEKLIKPFAIQR
jgi:M6 family metalloprotease-like protein